MSYPIERLVEQMEAVLSGNEAAAKREPHEKLGMFRYIPYNPQDFLDILHAATVVHKTQTGKNAKSFIDVGCGIGTKVLLAAGYGSLFETTDGVEYLKKYVEVAKRLLKGRPYTHVFQADGRKFDYSKYDIIYWYTPMNDKNGMDQLRAQILKTAHKNAVLMHVGYDTFTEEEKKRYRIVSITNQVSVKLK